MGPMGPPGAPGGPHRVVHAQRPVGENPAEDTVLVAVPDACTRVEVSAGLPEDPVTGSDSDVGLSTAAVAVVTGGVLAAGSRRRKRLA